MAAGNSNKEENYTANRIIGSPDNDISLATSQSPTHRDNTPSSLQRPDKHSQHSSLQNIQGDLNDILDRLQNMVANDCLLDGNNYLKKLNLSNCRENFNTVKDVSIQFGNRNWAHFCNTEFGLLIPMLASL